MLFGLFFGAGNLIFPVHVGQLAGGKAWITAAGFIVTGGGLPLLGVAAMGKSKSEGLLEMSGYVGKGWSVFFTCALYLTIGPFFAIPRCATTAFTVGFEPLLDPAGSPWYLLIFSILFFGAVLYFSLKPGQLLRWIGKIINPLFLALLGLLLLTALIQPMGTISELSPEPAVGEHSFFYGFFEGYNTMDALASLAFGIVVIQAVRNLGVDEPQAIAGCTLKAGIFCCLAMGLIYALTTLMGAQSRGLFPTSENGGIALAQITEHYYGKIGQILLAIMVFLACLKTAIGLVTSCAETFAILFPKLSYRKWAVLFSALPLIISNVGLTALVTYSVPVLMFLYPLAITLILLCLFGRMFHYERRYFVYVTAFTAVAAFFDLLRTLPAELRSLLHVDGLVQVASSILPLYSLGMGWVVPALAGFGVAFLSRKFSRDPVI